MSGIALSLCWSWLLSGMVQTLPSSFFPSQAANANCPDLAIGLVFTAYQASMIIFTPVAVYLTPRMGAQHIVRISMTLLLISNGLMAFTWKVRENETLFMLSTIGLRALAGAWSCGIMIGGNTCIMQSSKVSDLGYNLAVFETAGSVGLCIGPMLGSYLFALGGYETAFLGLSLLMLSGFLAPVPKALESELRSLVGDPQQEQRSDADRQPEAAESEGGQGIGWRDFAHGPYLVLLCVDLLACGVAWTFIDPILERHLNEVNHIGQLHAGYFFAAMSLTYILATGLVGVANKRMHKLKVWNYGVMYLGMALLGGALIMMRSNNVWIQLVALSIVGVGQAFTYLPIVLALTLTLKAGRKVDVSATVAGVSQISVSVGFALGPFVGSEITSRYGFHAACTGVGVATLVAAGLTACVLFMEVTCRCGSHKKKHDAGRYQSLGEGNTPSVPSEHGSSRA